MSVLALVTKPEEVGLVIPWALQFAKARETTLTVLTVDVIGLKNEWQQEEEPSGALGSVMFFLP